MKKIIAIILAAVVLIGVATGVGVYFFKFKTPATPTDINASAAFSDFTLNESVFEYVAKFPDRYQNAFINSYGMSKEESESVINEPENWLAFNLFITVTNNDDIGYAMSHLVISDNGSNNIFVSDDVNGTFTVAGANQDTEICVPVFIHDNEPSLDEVYEMVKSMDIRVALSQIPTDFDAETVTDYTFIQVDVK